MKQNPRTSEWFVEVKRKLHDAWKDVEDDYILKFAATEVSNINWERSSPLQYPQIHG